MSGDSGHLDMRDIVVEFNGFRAIEDFNLSVPKGELRCLIGPNGAGKTTTIRCMMDFIRPTQGTITIFGKISK